MRPLDEGTYRGIAALMHQVVGLHLGPAKKALVSSRLATRIQRLGLGGYDDYLALIEGPGEAGELQVAIDLLTTNETYFFREAAHFTLLEQAYARARPDHSVRAWSAAASYGDEAYSIAMVLADLQMGCRIAADWSVLGTDISDRVLRAAQEAVYPAERLRHVTPARLKRHCLRGEGEAEGLVQMRPHLRERVRFGQLNLREPIDVPGPFDLVFLRNVLIYFDTDTKRAVVERVLDQLRPGGLFFIGMAEGLVAGTVRMERIGAGAYRKPG